MKKLTLYMHAGSGNHGCEAIVNSLCHMLQQEVLVITNDKAEDACYSLPALCEIAEEKHINRHKLIHVAYYAWRKLTGDRESFLRYRYPQLFKGEPAKVAISIGGDNYCYDNMLSDLMLANSALQKKGTKTVLLGCSIEPELLKRQDVREDMRRYRLILARETITYQALLEAGMEPTRVKCCPDPAFTLGKKEGRLPAGFEAGKTIGLNVSPMIQSSEQTEGITLKNYHGLIRHILEKTDYKIALIPHVVWTRNDDRALLQKLYDAYKDTGRVLLTEDGTCEELKGVIAQCSYFIGARTHATIAAYSSLVPTLVVGYSVKAKGIARDLFGTEENYVLPVQNLKQEDDLTRAFLWLQEHGEEQKQRLAVIMPEYQKKALQIKKEVEAIWEE